MVTEKEGRGPPRPLRGPAAAPVAAAVLLAGLAFAACAAQARIVSLEITNRTSPTPGGGFGDVGPSSSSTASPAARSIPRTR